jgi:hypothetical protein
MDGGNADDAMEGFGIDGFWSERRDFTIQ